LGGVSSLLRACQQVVILTCRRRALLHRHDVRFCDR
jgi:hypothetical protein